MRVTLCKREVCAEKNMRHRLHLDGGEDGGNNIVLCILIASLFVYYVVDTWILFCMLEHKRVNVPL